jgi:hypothetical protein
MKSIIVAAALSLSLAVAAFAFPGGPGGPGRPGGPGGPGGAGGPGGGSKGRASTDSRGWITSPCGRFWRVLGSEATPQGGLVHSPTEERPPGGKLPEAVPGRPSGGVLNAQHRPTTTALPINAS